MTYFTPWLKIEHLHADFYLRNLHMFRESPALAEPATAERKRGYADKTKRRELDLSAVHSFDKQLLLLKWTGFEWFRPAAWRLAAKQSNRDRHEKSPHQTWYGLFLSGGDRI